MELVKPELDRTFWVFAQSAMQGLDAEFDPIDDADELWLQNHAAELVEGINQTTQAAISKEIEAGLAAGETIKELAARIETVFNRAERYRSFMIARTETTFTANMANLSVWERAGVSAKKWMAPHDERQCPVCSALDGTTIPLEEEFSSSTLVPPAHPNCLPPTEKVTTKRGEVPIIDIEEGDVVLTHEGRWRQVEYTMQHYYSGDVVVIRTPDSVLRLTPNHLVFTDKGWVRADCIQEGEHLVASFAGVLNNFPFVNTESAPATVQKIGVSDAPALPCFAAEVGVFIELDSYLFNRKGKVNNISPERILKGVLDFSRIKNVYKNLFFRLGGLSKVPCLGLGKLFQNFGPCNSILPAFSFGDFRTNNPFLFGVVHPVRGRDQVSMGNRSTELSPLGVSDILEGNCCGTVKGLNTKPTHELNQRSWLDAQDPLDLAVRYKFFKIAPFQPIIQRLTNFFRKALDKRGSWKRIAARFGAEFASVAGGLLKLLPAFEAKRHINHHPNCHCSITAKLSQVVSVEKERYKGMVYNLQVAEDESFVASGIAVHNCRCTLLAVFGDEITKHLPGKHDQSTHGRKKGRGLHKLMFSEGGFTYQPVTGESPTTGFALSISPQYEKAIPADKFNKKVIDEYHQEHKEVFKDPQNFLGGWHDKEAGKVYLDISCVVKDNKEAEKLCHKYKQEGYFDLGKGETVIVKKPEERRT